MEIQQVYSSTDTIGFILSVEVVSNGSERVIEFQLKHSAFPQFEQIIDVNQNELADALSALREAGIDV